jgi:hypothetical protein
MTIYCGTDSAFLICLLRQGNIGSRAQNLTSLRRLLCRFDSLFATLRSAILRCKCVDHKSNERRITIINIRRPNYI